VKVRAEGLGLVRERPERATADGDLPEGVDDADLARYLTTVVHGLAAQAAGGATRKETTPFSMPTDGPSLL
jgi:hypothetical protein